MTTVFDLSQKDELHSLAHVLRIVQDAAGTEIERWFIVGATARDLILRHVHGLPEGRHTVDLDVAIAVSTWDAFAAVEARLMEKGAVPHPSTRHRFELAGWRIDVLPFGGVDRNGVIAWPPDNEVEMSIAGFEEASRHAQQVRLPGGLVVSVASPPGLVILKFIAWSERHWDRPRQDAVDLRDLLKSYEGAWNIDRLYDDADDLLRHFGYDLSGAAAALLGRDVAAIALPATLDALRRIIDGELSSDSLVLAADMSGRVTENIALLEAFRFGLQDAALSRR